MKPHELDKGKRYPWFTGGFATYLGLADMLAEHWQFQTRRAA